MKDNYDISYVPFVKRLGYSPWSLVMQILITIEFCFQLCDNGISKNDYPYVHKWEYVIHYFHSAQTAGQLNQVHNHEPQRTFTLEESNASPRLDFIIAYQL